MEQNNTVIKRTFEAAKYPKGSEKREHLNLQSETSEYMTSYKYIAVIHHKETKNHVAYTVKMTFRTKTEAQDYLNSKN